MEYTLETLEEIQDQINNLEETVGLKPETMKDINLKISKRREQLKRYKEEREACPYYKKNECSCTGNCKTQPF